MNLHSYVVRYDSGFAPNPFHGYCTLATCKPDIRKSANIGDWIIGVGSTDRKIQLGGKLVYAMKVTESLSFNKYYSDPRFQHKKPVLTGSRKQARGDNIYHCNDGIWGQADSFHSNDDGSPKPEHISRDTKVDRVLISDDFIYFGGSALTIPPGLSCNGKSICHKARGRSKFSDSIAEQEILIQNFERWIRSLETSGFIAPPFDWSDIQGDCLC